MCSAATDRWSGIDEEGESVERAAMEAPVVVRTRGDLEMACMNHRIINGEQKVSGRTVSI
jgi:hypothetical protein